MVNLWNLYEKLSGMSVQSHGLTLVPKLKFVLGFKQSVSDAFAYFGDSTINY